MRKPSDRQPCPYAEPKAPFTLPRASIWSVLEVVREYDLWSLPMLRNPVVLDVGANVGVFVLFVRERWPSAVVHCYEPHPETFALLQVNVAGEAASVTHAAIDHPVGVVKEALLHEGDNRLCCSLVDRSVEGETLEGQGVVVPLLDAADLPPCDVLKLDVEGKEMDVLRGYQHLSGVKVFLVEVHREEDFVRVDEIARSAGMELVDRRGATLRFRRPATWKAADMAPTGYEVTVLSSVGG